MAMSNAYNSQYNTPRFTGYRSGGPVSGPYQAQYAQNQGLANAANAIRSRNMAMAGQPIPAYQPSMAAGGAGGYAAGMTAGGGLMNNSQAGQSYGLSGYVPNTTVGGNFGQRAPAGVTYGTPEYSAALGHDMAMARSNGYNASLPGYGYGTAGRMNGLAQANPAGAWYGGATPGMVAYSGGTRPGFQGSPAPAGQAWTPQQNQAFAAKQGLYYSPTTGAMGANPAVMGMTAGQVASAGVTGLGPNQRGLSVADAAAGRPAYEAALAQRQNDARQQTLDRVGTRNQNAATAQQNALAMQQQQMMMGLAQRNPALAMGLAQMQQHGQLTQAQLGLQQQQLAQQGLLGQQQSSDRRYVADQGLAAAQQQAWGQRYNAAINAGNTPDDAQRIAGPPPAIAPSGQAGGNTPGSVAPPAGLPAAAATAAAKPAYKPKKQLLDSQLAAIAALDPAERPNALRSLGVTNATDLYHYQRQIDPLHGTVPDQNLADLLVHPGMINPIAGLQGLGEMLGNFRWGLGMARPSSARTAPTPEWMQQQRRAN